MELKQEIKSSLRQVIAKEQGKVYHTGELRVIDLATDCLKAIEELEAKAYELDRRENGMAVIDNRCSHCKRILPPVVGDYCFRCGTKLIWDSEVSE